ncbi:hypothetical protein V501_05298 [Pseudogymnoascus sp. VKM F-4519 (FW-2642)]|nr:hypothetical protein V501_05298 [Pseudogymnoascus sp. VKM F-4519 (FW-2642)]
MVKRSREDSDPPPLSENNDSVYATDSSGASPHPTDPNAYEAVKIVHLDPEHNGAATVEVMRCSLPGHRPDLSFHSFDDYEVHYSKSHVNRCVECRKNFPTEHFLSLHQAENHDPLVGVLRDRGEHTYACFVEDCDRKCSTPQKRRLHLIDKHSFPKEYDFFVVNDGIDRKSSMLRSGRHRRRSSIMQQKIYNESRGRNRSGTMETDNTDEASETTMANTETDGATRQDVASPVLANAKAAVLEDGDEDAEIEGLTGAISALRFVPPSVKFGRGRGRAGFSKS